MSDSIRKTVTLRAPRARVWRALSDAREFGEWFGVRFDRPFTPGASLRGTVTPTKADPEVAKHQKPYEGLTFDIVVDRVEPERLFSFRWHPNAIDKGVDYASEPTTLIVFELEDAPGGPGETKLTVTESGFDRIPLERRAKAFTANDQGWAMQMTLIARHLAARG